MSRRVVIVGGFTTGKRLLEPVANVVCDRFGFTDADIFTFPEAIDSTEDLERAMKGQTVLEHSAGLLAVAKCTGMERVVAFNAPEPAGLPTALVRAAIKTGNLYHTAIAGPHRKGAMRVIVDNAVQAITHSVAHARQLAAVGQFSTTKQLALMESTGIQTARIDTEGDEFFGPHEAHPWDGKRVVLSGRHDQLLIDPAGFIAQLPEDALLS